MEVINSITDLDTAKLVGLCLTFTFFIFQGESCDKMCGVTMGSPLSPMVANLFMEDFETEALASTPLHPKIWKRFVNDTFVDWQYGRDSLDSFLSHLNNQSESIKFIMEIEVNGSLPFLDGLISKKGDGTFSHQVYRKKTGTEQYLHASSHHYPPQKFGVLNTLATRALRISDESHFESEKSHLLNFFEDNDYNRLLGLKDFQKACLRPKPNKDPLDLANCVHLLFILGTTNKITHILNKNKVHTSFKPLNTIWSSLR